MQFSKEFIKAAVKAHYKSTPKKVAASNTEKEREQIEQQRQKLISKAIASLTANLPVADFSPNSANYIYKRQIAEKAFESSLENGITWLSYKDQIHIEVEDQLIQLKATDFKAAAAFLYSWSGISRQYLADSKGKPADQFSLWNSLLTVAAARKTMQDRCKTSDEHLTDLVEACAKSQPVIKGNRDAVMIGLIEDTVKVAKRLRLEMAFSLNGTLYLNCSDSPYKMVALKTKQTLPYFAQIIENSPVAGRLQASFDPQNLLDGFTRKQKRV